MRPTVHLLCIALSEANTSIIKQLQLGEHLAKLKQTVVELIAPAITHLEDRVKRAEHPQGLNPDEKALLKETKQALESARGDWCNLLGDEQLNQIPEMRDAVSDMLSIVLEPALPLPLPSPSPPSSSSPFAAPAPAASSAPASASSHPQQQQDAVEDDLLSSRAGSERMTQQEDLLLSKSYAETMKRLASEGPSSEVSSRIS